MTSIPIRHADASDAPALLALFDEAVAWLVARGQPEQWGSVPWSTVPRAVERVNGFAAGGDFYIAGEDAGAIVLGEAFEYVPAPERPELYVQVLLTHSAHRGAGVGAALIDHAKDVARARGAEQLRVDCYAGVPELPRQYERLGCTRTGDFDVDGWAGAVLELRLPDRSP